MSHTPDDPKSPPPPPDPTDPDFPKLLRRWLLDLRVAFDDIDSVMEDMRAPVREREFGHAQHARLYSEARGQIVQMLDYMMSIPIERLH